MELTSLVTNIFLPSGTNILVKYIESVLMLGKHYLSGTVLQGKAKLNDDIELPSIALIKKIKSIEVFRKPVETLVQGDRAGICVTQFDPKTLERGLACQVNYLPKVYAAIIDFNKVKYYKGSISSKSVFHINIGYENVTGKIVLFSSLNNSGIKLTFFFESFIFIY